MCKFMVFYFILDSFSIHNSTLSNDFGPINTEIVKMDSIRTPLTGAHGLDSFLFQMDFDRNFRIKKYGVQPTGPSANNGSEDNVGREFNKKIHNFWIRTAKQIFYFFVIFCFRTQNNFILGLEMEIKFQNCGEKGII